MGDLKADATYVLPQTRNSPARWLITIEVDQWTSVQTF